MNGSGVSASRGRGRPAVSSRSEIERIAMALFLEHGYGATTIPMIAAESGVSRTSIFRYWGTKPEIIWSEFDKHTSRLRQLLSDADPALPAMDVVRVSVIENLHQSMMDSASWLDRFAVIESSPELRADESERWRTWAATVAVYLQERLGLDDTAILPHSIGAAVQAAFVTVLQSRLKRWDGSETLLSELDEALRRMQHYFDAWITDSTTEGDEQGDASH